MKRHVPKTSDDRETVCACHVTLASLEPASRHMFVRNTRILPAGRTYQQAFNCSFSLATIVEPEVFLTKKKAQMLNPQHQTPRKRASRSTQQEPAACSRAASPSANIGVGMLLLLSVVIPEMSPSLWKFNGAYNALFDGPWEPRCGGPLGRATAGNFWRLGCDGTASSANAAQLDDDDEEEEDCENGEIMNQIYAVCGAKAPPSPASNHLSGSEECDVDSSETASSSSGCMKLPLTALEQPSAAFIGPQFMLPTVHSFDLTVPGHTTEQAYAVQELPAAYAHSTLHRLLPWHSVDQAASPLALAIAFLPLKDALSCAVSCKELSRAVRCAMPVTANGFLCIPYAAPLSDAASPTVSHVCASAVLQKSSNASASPSSKQRGGHKCRECRVGSAGPNSRCAQCLARNPSGDIVRVFMGQLRRDRTNGFPRFVLNMFFPEMHIPHVESHTGMDNRGKGCAWVHVSNETDAHRLLSISRRLFMDLDKAGQEVVLLCRPTAAAQEELKAFAARCAEDSLRPLQLPRQPILFELPKNPAPATPSKRSGTHIHHQSPPAAAHTRVQQEDKAVIPQPPSGGLSQHTPKATRKQQSAGGSLAPAVFTRLAQNWFVPSFASFPALSHDPYGVDVLGARRMYTAAQMLNPNASVTTAAYAA
jgi:hypothetical protein